MTSLLAIENNFGQKISKGVVKDKHITKHLRVIRNAWRFRFAQV